MRILTDARIVVKSRLTNEQKLVTLAQLRDFLAATEAVEFQGCDQDQGRYRHIETVLKRFGYGCLKRVKKAVVLRYLEPSLDRSAPNWKPEA